MNRKPHFKQVIYTALLMTVFGNTYTQSSLPQIIQPSPQPAQLGRYDQNQFMQLPKPQNLPNYNSIPDWQRQQYNTQLIMQDMRDYDLQKQREAEIKKEITNEPMVKENAKWLEKAKWYKAAFDDLNRLNPDNFSVIKATYLVENAYYNNKLPFDKFIKAISDRAQLVKQILKREHLDAGNNMALNYGIQQLFSRANNYYDPKTKRTVTIPPLTYDFRDFMGKENHEQVFVSKLMAIGTGQCHSMPLLYLCIAEILGAKANLSLAPSHSYIQFPDTDGRLLSFECTNGSFVSENWMLQSGFITATALKNRTYMDTLSKRQLFAQCLADLSIGYEKKFGYDGFLQQVEQTIEKTDPNNLSAKMLASNITTVRAMSLIKATGAKKPQDLPQYPEAYQAYLQMLEKQKQLDNTGFQEMPEAAYQAWLKSIAEQLKKQENKEIEQRIQVQLNKLKTTKPIIKNKLQ